MYLQASTMVVATVFYLLPERYICVYIYLFFLITEGVFSALVVKLNINLLWVYITVIFFFLIGNSKAALNQVVFFGHQFVHTWRAREVFGVNFSLVWHDQFLRTHGFSSSSYHFHSNG